MRGLMRFSERDLRLAGRFLKMGKYVRFKALTNLGWNPYPQPRCRIDGVKILGDGFLELQATARREVQFIVRANRRFRLISQKLFERSTFTKFPHASVAVDNAVPDQSQALDFRGRRRGQGKLI